jgi:hypothetical protein
MELGLFFLGVFLLFLWFRAIQREQKYLDFVERISK